MSPSENQRHIRFLRSFTANEAAIRAYVRRMVPTRGDADDVMQETSVVLWEKFDTLREDGDFRTWAFGVARFEVLAWLRDRGRDRLVLNEEVIARLTEVKGIGRWTAEMFLMFNLGRPDVLPVDDLGVRRGFMLAWGKRKMPEPKALKKYGERWKPYRTAASWYLWRAADAG